MEFFSFNKLHTLTITNKYIHNMTFLRRRHVFHILDAESYPKTVEFSMSFHREGLCESAMCMINHRMFRRGIKVHKLSKNTRQWPFGNFEISLIDIIERCCLELNARVKCQEFFKAARYLFRAVDKILCANLKI